MWYTTEGIANVSSLARVTQHFQIKYDSAVEDGYFTAFQHGSTKILTESNGGLFYYNMATEDGMLFVTTVRDRRENYTKSSHRT